MKDTENKISPRDRVNLALSHKTPDRIPVDFLAVPEIWNSLIQSERVIATPHSIGQTYEAIEDKGAGVIKAIEEHVKSTRQ